MKNDETLVDILKHTLSERNYLICKDDPSNSSSLKFELKCKNCRTIIPMEKIKTTDESGMFVFMCRCDYKNKFDISQLIMESKADIICYKIFSDFGIKSASYLGDVLKADDCSMEIEIFLDRDNYEDPVVVKIEITK